MIIGFQFEFSRFFLLIYSNASVNCVDAMYCEGQPAYIRGDEGEAATDEHILFGLKSQFQNNL